MHSLFWWAWNTIATGLLLGLSLNLVIPFLVWHYSKGINMIVYDFNAVGEAAIEAILFPIIIVMGTVTFIRQLIYVGR